MSVVQLSNLSFRYPESNDLIFRDIDLTVGPGWTGVVGANGIGKTTLARIALGELPPTDGHVSTTSGLYCPQQTRTIPDALSEFLSVPDGSAARLADRLAIEDDWLYRWDTLSPGEQKRAQLAAVVWLEPDLLIVDEPTNHLDQINRRWVVETLHAYTGIGLVISHDRELLDRICDRCAIIRSPSDVTLRPGGVSDALQEEERENLEAGRCRKTLETTVAAAVRESRRRSAVAATQDRKRSKRNLSRKDSDGRARIDLARFTGKDGDAGRRKTQMEGRIAHLSAQLETARTEAAARSPRKTGVDSIAAQVNPVGRDHLVHFESSRLDLGEQRRLIVPSLSMSPRDRIGLSGENGSGKTTLVRRIVDAIGAMKFLYMPQELPPDTEEVIHQALGSLSSLELGEVLAFFSRLGSDPERVRSRHRLSPGEYRKLLVAIGLLRRPPLMILDEPTNHLDLPSIRALGDALTAYTGALLVVSHDSQFLEAVTNTVWRFVPDGTRGGVTVTVE